MNEPTGHPNVSVNWLLLNTLPSDRTLSGHSIYPAAGDIFVSDGSGVLSFGKPYIIVPAITITTVAANTAYTLAGSFTWDVSKYGDLNNPEITFHATIFGVRTLDIRVFNSTTTTQLAATTGIASSGFYTLSFTEPVADALLEVQIRRSAGGGTSPQVDSCAFDLTL